MALKWTDQHNIYRQFKPDEGSPEQVAERFANLVVSVIQSGQGIYPKGYPNSADYQGEWQVAYNRALDEARYGRNWGHLAAYVMSVDAYQNLAAEAIRVGEIPTLHPHEWMGRLWDKGGEDLRSQINQLQADYQEAKTRQAPSRAEVPPEPEAEGEVDRLQRIFKTAIGREATASELAQIAENQAEWNKKTLDAFNEYLGRVPSDEELVSWAARKVAYGQDESAYITRAISESPESQIIYQYQNWVGRSPTPSELALDKAEVEGKVRAGVVTADAVNDVLGRVADSPEARAYGDTPEGAARQMFAGIPRPPIPYDEARPFAFDEALARASAEAEYNPYYQELLDEFLEAQGVTRERGIEDYAQQEQQVAKDLDSYLEEIGIRQGRLQEAAQEYLTTQGIAQERLGTDAARRLTELGVSTTRMAGDREQLMEQYARTQSRLLQDIGRQEEEARLAAQRAATEQQAALEQYGIAGERAAEDARQRQEDLATQAQRISELRDVALQKFGLSGERLEEDIARRREEQGIAQQRLSEEQAALLGQYGVAEQRLGEDVARGQTSQEIARTRLGEEQQALLGEYGVGKQRLTEDETRLLAQQEAEQESYLSREKRLWQYAYEQARQGQAARGVLTSGVGGQERERLATEREAALTDYMRGQDIARADVQREARRGLEDIARRETTAGRQYGYGLEDINRAVEELGIAGQRGTEDIAREREATQRRGGYAAQDIERALQELGITERRGQEDIALGEEQTRREARYGLEDIQQQGGLIGEALRRGLQDIALQQAASQRQYGYGQEDIGRALESLGISRGRGLEDILTQRQTAETAYTRGLQDIGAQTGEVELALGRGMEDIGRAIEEYQRGYGYNIEDLLRQARLSREQAETALTQIGTSRGRLLEDVARQEQTGQRGIQRERTGAIEGGILQRRGEALEEYETGRRQYYSQYPQFAGYGGYY